MCLTSPGRVLSTDGEWAVVQLDGAPRRASLAVAPDAAVGDWVLVAAGLVLEVMDDDAMADLARLLDPRASIHEGVTA